MMTVLSKLVVIKRVLFASLFAKNYESRSRIIYIVQLKSVYFTTRVEHFELLSTFRFNVFLTIYLGAIIKITKT